MPALSARSVPAVGLAVVAVAMRAGVVIVAGPRGGFIGFRKRSAADTLHDHRNDRRDQNAPDDDQYQLHGATLATPRANNTSAGGSASIVGKLAAIGPKSPGISAYLPLQAESVLIGASAKEDKPWLTTHHPKQAAVAESDGSLLVPSLFWSCSTRFSPVAASARHRTQLASGRFRTQRQPRLSHLKPRHRSPIRGLHCRNDTTHALTTKGGCRTAPAFGMRPCAVRTRSVRAPYAINIPEIEVTPC